jgi:hypothetical protein
VKLTIKINMDNAAFEPNNGTEIARILERYATVVRGENLTPRDAQILRDINGNAVGEAKVTS